MAARLPDSVRTVRRSPSFSALRFSMGWAVQKSNFPRTSKAAAVPQRSSKAAVASLFHSVSAVAAAGVSQPMRSAALLMKPRKIPTFACSQRIFRSSSWRE